MLQSHLCMEDVELPNLRRTTALINILREEKLLDQRLPPEEAAERRLQREQRHSGRYVQEPAGISPRTYLRRKATQSLQQLDYLDIPMEIQNNYHGLSYYEASAAYQLFSIEAKLVEETHPLHHSLKALCDKVGIAVPRLILMDSDIPTAAAFAMPGIPPSVILTTNMMEILKPKELEAVMAHELEHIRRRQHLSWEMCGVKEIIANWTHNLPVIWEEYDADQLAKKLVGAPEYLVDALVKCQQRMFEIKDCARKMGELVDRYHISRWGAFPPRFNELLATAHAEFRVMPEKNIRSTLQANKHDPHPSMVARMDALFDDSGKAGRG